jgi:flagellar hook-basal body complex protein FliE
MSIDRTIGPVDRSIARVEPLSVGPATSEQSGQGGFLNVLREQLDQLVALQEEAAGMQQALATGQVDDLTQVVLAVQKADLALNFALQLRNKVIEAYQEISRMQV